jgi:hypothetical protein
MFFPARRPNLTATSSLQSSTCLLVMLSQILDHNASFASVFLIPWEDLSFVCYAAGSGGQLLVCRHRFTFLPWND